VARPNGGKRFSELFTINIRNRNTCRHISARPAQFSAQFEDESIPDLAQIEPLHVVSPHISRN
jgi:hypothetical protein